jgi:hypothetical protein
MSRLSVESEQASPMKHRRDLDDVMSHAVDDSVVAVDDLADRLVSVSTLSEGNPPVPRAGSVMAGPFRPQGFRSIDSAFSRIQSISSRS